MFPVSGAQKLEIASLVSERIMILTTGTRDGGFQITRQTAIQTGISASYEREIEAMLCE